jgi:uncharacterized iron-regulated membrane protein
MRTIRIVDLKMRQTSRRLWLTLHRYAALGLGWLLALAALLGAALTVAKPLDHWWNAPLFVQAPAAAPAQLEPIRLQLQREFGPSASFTLRPPREAQDTLWAYVRGPWDGIVFLDAGSGRELGRRAELEGLYNLLFELHSSLLLGDAGQAVLTTAAMVYLLLLASGLVLWWPVRWPPRLTVRWSGGALRGVFDLHSVGGALLGLLIAVSVATGAYMAWPPLRPLVSSLVGQVPLKPPSMAPVGGPRMPLDELVRRARAEFPDGQVGYIQAGPPSQPVRVRLRLPDDPHPNGLSSVWLHPVSGAVLAAHRWDRLDAGHRAVSVIYPLHTGALGGTVHTVAVGLLGLTLAGLGGTGLWLWWKRRQARRAPPVGVAASG